MGSDWHDPNARDRRQQSNGRQPQNSRPDEQWDEAGWDEWKRRVTGDLSSSGAPGQRPSGAPLPPVTPRQSGGSFPPVNQRQSGGYAPHNGSGLISRARSGGASGPLPPERASGPLGPRTSGPLTPPERPTRQSNPGSAGASGSFGQRYTPPPEQRAPGRSGAFPRDDEFATLGPGEPFPPEAPRRPGGRSMPGAEPAYPDDATLVGPNGNGRRQASPPRQTRGGGLLSFARAASSQLRAIITGKHAAQGGRLDRPQAPSPMPPPPAPEGEGQQPPPPRYRRSRARLVIHKRWERRSQHGKRAMIGGSIVAVLFGIVATLSIVGVNVVYAFYQDSQSKLNALSSPTAFLQTTRIYDRNGVLLFEYKAPDDPDRIYLQYGQIPDSVKKATVDTEDNTFWTNSGINLLSIIRAGLGDVQSQQITGGGSTITQQLIKNAFFLKNGVAAQNIQRKIQEALMAYAVTNKYSKQDILEFYLNIIFYGYFSAGIEAAAENIFNLMPRVDNGHLIMGAQQLDPAQAELLAGLPQSPTDYSPCGGDDVKARREAALQRMHDVVLTSMLRLGDITQAQFDHDDAEAHKPDFFKCRDIGEKKAGHFVDYVVDQLALMLTTDGTLETGKALLANAGLNVYTTLDYRIEQEAEKSVTAHLYQTHQDTYAYDTCSKCPPLSLPESQGGHNIHDAAVVVIDPRNGDILAMDGSADYNNTTDEKIKGSFNATTGYLQSGSSFKPIVYATAFEMGWFPALALHDQQTCFPITGTPSAFGPTKAVCGNYYAPNNYDFYMHWDAGPGAVAHTTCNKQSGCDRLLPNDKVVHVRDALGNSLNIPAVQTMYFAGIENVINTAHRLGIYSNPSQGGKFDDFSTTNAGPALALGAASIRLLDLTGAYATFANEGYRVPPRAILLVTDSQGNVVPGGDFSAVTRTQVLSPQTCYMLTSILSDNNARQAEFGTNNALWFHNQPWAAAKTGTTEDFKDNLTVGYTPYLAVGVWAGNADGSVMGSHTLGITGAAPIWHDVVAYATQLYKYPNSYWPLPDGVHQYSVNGLTGLAPYQGEAGNYADWFNDAEVPTSNS
jgi:membrane peptidoglycan carboxypeptidase